MSDIERHRTFLQGHRGAIDLIAAWELFKFSARQLSSNISAEQAHGREVLLRCFDRLEDFPPDVAPVINDLIQQYGLYPYLKEFEEDLDSRAAVRYEYFRSENTADKVLHREQQFILDKLLSGTSVVISAPTSFGKSLLIEEIVASKRFANIAIIQPTLALIDETRDKLKKYSETYKTIFSASQKFAARNVFVLTPERLVEMEELPKIDFFVIDEFYKLSLDRKDERAATLNHAFYKLLKHTKHFYLLGPLIANIPQKFVDQYCVFMNTRFATVAVDFKRIVTKPKDRPEALFRLLDELNEPTLIYCQSPGSAEKYAREYAAHRSGRGQTSVHDEAIDWIKTNVSDGWSLIGCLKHEIGFHHGKVPRYLAKYLVNSFNGGTVKNLFCTSTLIEGVNTVAKNVAIVDSKKGQKQDLDFFDFANISGRSGRMGHHVIGRVFSFFEAPAQGDLYVDIPWFTQENAPPEILIQLDAEDLAPKSAKRIEAYRNNPWLPVEILQKNSSVNLEGQVALAEYLHKNLNEALTHLRWAKPISPTYDELKYACNLIWQYFIPEKRLRAGVASGDSLTLVINRYRTLKNIPPLIAAIYKNGRERDEKYTIDKAVQDCMDQIRTWGDFQFPRLLSALHHIQAYVFQKYGKTPANLIPFAVQVENGFVTSSVSALTEFGVPFQLAKKLERVLRETSSVDSVLSEIRSTNWEQSNLHPFEKRILSRV